MDRLLRGAPGTIDLLVYDTGGNLVDLDDPPTVTIRDGAGVEVQTGGSAHVGTGVYRFIVTSATTTRPLDVWTASWVGALTGEPTTLVTRFETVGGFAFTLDDLRRSWPGSLTGQKGLSDDTKYPPERLIDARNKAEDRFEAAAGVAVVPRGRRIRIPTRYGATSLLLPDLEVTAVYSATVDDLAVDLGATPAPFTLDTLRSTLAYADGSPWRSAYGTGGVDLHYEHGLTEVPGPVQEAVMTLARALYLTASSMRDSRATAEFSDAGGFRLTIAGRDGWTGIPEVDEVIREFGRPRPAVG